MRVRAARRVRRCGRVACGWIPAIGARAASPAARILTSHAARRPRPIASTRAAAYRRVAGTRASICDDEAPETQGSPRFPARAPAGGVHRLPQRDGVLLRRPSGGAHHVAWNDGPDWEINPHFVGQVKKVASMNRPVVLICRSGHRSIDAGDGAREGRASPRSTTCSTASKDRSTTIIIAGRSAAGARKACPGSRPDDRRGAAPLTRARAPSTRCPAGDCRNSVRIREIRATHRERALRPSSPACRA